MESSKTLSSVNFYSEIPEEAYLSARVMMNSLELGFWFSSSEKNEIDGYIRCDFFGSLPGFLDILGNPYILLYSRVERGKRVYFIESFLASSDSFEISTELAKRLMAGDMPVIFSRHSEKSYRINVYYRKKRKYIGIYNVP